MIELKVEFPKELFESKEGNELFGLMTEHLEEAVINALWQATDEFRRMSSAALKGKQGSNAQLVHERVADCGRFMAAKVEEQWRQGFAMVEVKT
jgi:hypothetical protein